MFRKFENNSKRFLSALCALVVLISSYAGYVLPFQVNAAESTSPVLDLEEDVKWFGRTVKNADGSRSFSWSNSGFRFSFYGTEAVATMKAKLSTAGTATQTAYIKIYVDDVLVNDVAVPETETQMTLASGLKEGLHTVKVIKRTSGYYSNVTVSQIQLNAGAEIRTTQKYFERKILFLGDDFTTGYGSKVTNAMVSAGTAPTAYSAETEDSTIGYTALAADYFGAENMTVALIGGSGRGIGINGAGGTSHKASDYFEYLDYRQWIGGKKVVYDHTQYDPDIIVINLGNYDEHYYSKSTNSDGGATLTDAEKTTFETNCKNFILRVRASYPTAKILYTYGINYNAFVPNVQNVITSLTNSGYRDIYFKQITKLATAEKGLSGKPTTEAHAARSTELIAAIKDITGWTGKDELKNPVSSDVQLEASYEPFAQTDISVMSYNVLAHSSDTDEIWSARQPKVVKMVKAYNPDLVGFQEASGPTSSYTHDWPAYLSNNLTEYTAVRMRDQAGGSASNIANGLVIMFKKDRFTKLADGCVNMKSKATVDGKTDTDNDRWFQWVKLQENKTGMVFYFYNTHLSINPTNSSYSDAQKVAFGNIHRTNECAQLAKHVAETNAATKCPFFVVGDFNTSFSTANSATETTKNTLNQIVNYGGTDIFKDSATIAEYTRFTNYLGSIDHVFVNSRYVDVKEYHVAHENVDGRRTTDHAPHISYCNFKADATINGVSTEEKEFKAESASNTYTFNFDFRTSSKCEIYDGATGSLLATKTADGSQSVTLAKAVNQFGIKFYDGNGKYTCTVTAIITNTSATKPTVTATGSVVNQYFTNGAYHVLVNGDTLDLTTSDGNFYENPYASRGETATLGLTAIKAGRTVYYLKTAAGDIYPVYVYKQTAAANTENSVLYVEDDIEGATGTVAFYDGKDVIFAEAGTKVFSTVEAVAEKANTINGATVYFAPGLYDSNEVKFTKNVTLLGNNYDVSAVEIKTPNWAKAGRKSETIIDGILLFESAGDLSVTIKGFSFEGKVGDGAIYFNDTTANATKVTHSHVVDIQNNILTSGSNHASGTYPSVIYLYSGAQVKGTIKNNYFCSTVNQESVGANGLTRAVRVKNANGLVVESNYFRRYEICLYFTDKISSAVAGNSNYVVMGNRFEHCGKNLNYLTGVTKDSISNISYLHNDFVRSGGSTSSANYAIDFNFNQEDLGNDCSRMNISVIGNRFADCYRSLEFIRTNAAAQTANLAEANVRVNRNSFINPTEGLWKKYFRSINFAFCVVGNTPGMEIPADKWNFADNHFESTLLVTELAELKAHSTPYREDIYEMNYIRHYRQESKSGTDNQSFVISAEHFKAQAGMNKAYDSIAGAFNQAAGVSSDGYSYDFDNDIAGTNLYKGVSGIKDKMIFGIKDSSKDSVSVTKNKTLEFKGRTALYAENRWNCGSDISFDLRTTAINTGSNRSAFHFKFGHWLTVANKIVAKSDFYSGGNIDGCFVTFATVNNVPTVKLFISYKDSTGAKTSAQYTFENIVSSVQEFNTFRMVENEGTIDLYANGTQFAQMQCSNNEGSTNSYYDSIDVYVKQEGALVKSGETVTNTLVTKDTAIAFATSNSDTTNGQTLEIDNLSISNVITEPVEKPSELKIDAMQINLSDEINMQFLVRREIFDAAGYSNPVIKAGFDENMYELQATADVIGGVPCYIFTFKNITPQMMNDTIFATLCAEKDGIAQTGITSEYSVALYAYTQLKTTTNAKFRTLLVDMLRYGSAAQTFTQHNQNNLVDAALTPEQAAWGTQTLRTLVSSTVIPDFAGDATWLGMGLNVENKVAINAFFDVESTEGLYIKVTDKNHNVLHTITQESFGSVTGPNGTPVVSFVYDKLAATQMSDVVGFTVYDANGTNISGTFLCSVESYAAKVYNSTNESFANLISSMMKYGDAARAFAG